METLKITLFGHVTVVHPKSETPLKLSRGGQAILAYLLLQPRLVPRDVLMDVFWTDTPPDRARSSLATALWRLRQLLEPSDVRPGTYLITRNTGEVGFNRESLHWLDTDAFEVPIQSLLRKPMSELCAADINSIEGLLTLYCGDLLEGIYEDWALREREYFRTLHLNCLTRLMEYYAGQGNFERSIAYGHEILRRDPVREEVHRGLMRTYLESGQRALAVRQYVHCRQILDQELGVSPLEETQLLYQQIIAASHSSSPACGQLLSQEIVQLRHELQRAKQSLDETTRALERISQAVSLLAKSEQTVHTAAGQRH